MTTPAAAVLPEVELLPPGAKDKGTELLTASRDVMTVGAQFMVEIKDADTYGKAVLYAQDLDRKIKLLENEREGICPPLFKAHRNATSFFNRLINPYAELKAAIENATTRFRLEQDRLKRLEEERQAAIERKRREMNEQHDLAFAEDKARLVAFLKAYDEAVEMDADRARAKAREEEEAGRLAHAQVAEDVGNKDGVSAILNTPTPLAPAPIVFTAPQIAPPAPAAMMPAPDITPTPVIVPSAPPPPPITEIPPPAGVPAFVPAMKGVTQKTNWLFKIKDRRRLLKAILNDEHDAITLKTLEFNDGAKGEIGELVRKQKQACVDILANIGIEVWSEADDKIHAPKGS